MDSDAPTYGSTPTPPLAGRRLGRQSSTSSDRLSQLFPSRSDSATSISPIDTPSLSRRTSFPSPLVPASEPSYRIPRAPAPPSFSDNDSFAPTGSQSSLQTRGGTKRLLNRLASLRSGRSDYNKLEDEESGRRLQGVEEVDEPVGYDLSGFDGGMPMRKLDPPKSMSSTADAIEAERDINEAGFAAEYERLEAQLGAGMASVMEVPFTHQAAQPQQESSRGHKRGLSNSRIIEVAAQKEAEKTGGIVAVAEITVDISDLASPGTEFDSRSALNAGQPDANESQTSYYFPPGTQPL